MKNLKSKLGALGISTKSSAVYHSPGSTLTQILCRKSMRNALCRWSSYFSWKVWWPYDKYGIWKNGLESKGLKVNMGKTKVMILGRDFHTLQTSGIYPCTVCRKGVGKNSVFCSRYSFWVHKKCFDIPGKLVENPDFMCRRCLGNAWANWWKTLCWNPTCWWKASSNCIKQLTILSILVTVFVEMDVVSLPLLRDAALHGEI